MNTVQEPKWFYQCDFDRAHNMGNAGWERTFHAASDKKQYDMVYKGIEEWDEQLPQKNTNERG
ncbi:MAG: hypothetical protein U0J65_01045 [Christensenellales bacterium]|nr:hypothetical protein [Christensenellales bacterium]